MHASTSSVKSADAVRALCLPVYTHTTGCSHCIICCKRAPMMQALCERHCQASVQVADYTVTCAGQHWVVSVHSEQCKCRNSGWCGSIDQTHALSSQDVPQGPPGRGRDPRLCRHLQCLQQHHPRCRPQQPNGAGWCNSTRQNSSRSSKAPTGHQLQCVAWQLAAFEGAVACRCCADMLALGHAESDTVEPLHTVLCHHHVVLLGLLSRHT